MTHIPRWVLLAILAVLGAGCRDAPSGVGERQSKQSADTLTVSPENEPTTADCGPGFRGQRIAPPRLVLQHETPQTLECTGDACWHKAVTTLKPGHFQGDSCEQIRQNLSDNPIVDVWGAQARVICNGEVAQALSAGYDGKLGTCDDLSRITSAKPRKPNRP